MSHTIINIIVGIVFGGLFWSAGLIAFPVARTMEWSGLLAAMAAVGMSDEFPILLFMLPSLGLFAFKLAQSGFQDRLAARVAEAAEQAAAESTGAVQAGQTGISA